MDKVKTNSEPSNIYVRDKKNGNDCLESSQVILFYCIFSEVFRNIFFRDFVYFG